MARSPSMSHGPRPKRSALRGFTIGFIGAGTMGRALIKGLLTQGISRKALRASDPSARARREVRRTFHIAVTDDNLAVVRNSDVLVLAVKPQQFPELVAQIVPALNRHQLVISIAAGITLRWLQTRLPGQPIVRVMPNLPATVGRGFSVIATGRAATARHRAMALAMFGAVGEVAGLPERAFDAVTAVSGSGPAYVFFLVEAWETAAKQLGLPSSVASRAIQQTLEGSVRLLRTAEEPASALIEKVASKGGTTEAALRVLARRHVAAHVVEALQADTCRSKQLSMS